MIGIRGLLYCFALLLSITSGLRAATVTGSLLTVTGTSRDSDISFEPMDAPFSDGINIIEWPAQKTRSSGGQFTISLTQGSYRVRIDSIPIGFIRVPAGTGVYNIVNMFGAFVYLPTPLNFPSTNAVGVLYNDGDGNLTWNPNAGGGGGGGSATFDNSNLLLALTGFPPTDLVQLQFDTNYFASASSKIVPAAVGTAGTFGDASDVAQITVDAKGRVTGVTLVPIAAANALTNLTFIGNGIAVSGSPASGGSGTITLSLGQHNHAASDITSGVLTLARMLAAPVDYEVPFALGTALTSNTNFWYDAPNNNLHVPAITASALNITGTGTPTSYFSTGKASTIALFDANTNLVGGTVGSGLTLSGGTLSATAGSGAIPGTVINTGASTATQYAKYLDTSGTNIGPDTITLASADFANQGTTTTVLHGNAAGNPSFGAVALGTDVSGTLLAAQFPALTGDITTSAGSLATTLKTSPTIVTPTIASFINATHNHQNAAGGGTLTLASAAFANQGTTATVLHGNAAGNPSFGAVALGTDVSGTLLAAQFPALTGDVTTSAGSLAATVAKINGATLGTTTATAGNILVGSGSQWGTTTMSGDATLASSGAITLAHKTRTIILPINNPTVLPASGAAQLDSSENDFRLLFSVNDNAMWQFYLPDDYASGLTIKVLWKAVSATTGNFTWSGEWWAVTPGDSADMNTQSFDTADTQATTVPGTAGFLTSTSITSTHSDSAAAGDWVQLRLKVSAATATGQAAALALAVSYTQQ